MKKHAILKQCITLALLLLLAFGCSSGVPSDADAADDAPMSIEDASAVLANFDPSIKVVAIDSAPIPELWEVIVNVNGEVGIVYITADKKHLILGSVVDAATKHNLTKDKFESVKAKYEPKADFSTIPLDNAVVMGDPKAKHKVVVFDDPD